MRIVVDATAAVRQHAGVGRFARGILSGLASLDAHNDYTLLTIGKARLVASPLQLPARHHWLRLPISERVARIAWQQLMIGPPPTLFVRDAGLFFTPDFVLPPVGRVPGVLTVHDLSYLVHPECADSGLRRYLERSVPRSIARAAAVVAVSHTTARALHDLMGVPEARIHVVGNGVGSQFSPLAVSEHANISADARLTTFLRERFRLDPGYLLTVGTLEPRKNLMRLFQALRALRRRKRFATRGAVSGAPIAFRNVQLVIVGREGWLYEPIFKEVARLGLRDSVRFFTRIDDADLVPLYRGASAFVYPSLYEGFGIPPLEAMACGLPVAASVGGALAEVLSGAAMLFDPFDVDAIASSVERILTDETERARLIPLGLQRARAYTWDGAGRAALALFNRLAA